MIVIESMCRNLWEICLVKQTQHSKKRCRRTFGRPFGMFVLEWIKTLSLLPSRATTNLCVESSHNFSALTHRMRRMASNSCRSGTPSTWKWAVVIAISTSTILRHDIIQRYGEFQSAPLHCPSLATLISLIHVPHALALSLEHVDKLFTCFGICSMTLSVGLEGYGLNVTSLSSVCVLHTRINVIAALGNTPYTWQSHRAFHLKTDKYVSLGYALVCLISYHPWHQKT